MLRLCSENKLKISIYNELKNLRLKGIKIDSQSIEKFLGASNIIRIKNGLDYFTIDVYANKK